MKSVPGFVAVAKDGMFYHISERSTHTGYHVDMAVVSDIEHATVFSIPRVNIRYKKVDMPEGTTLVPVEVRREVILTGFGVETK